ncbi:DUF2946 domain-containing protein [Kalamiella sp. sgz302252]|uniref:DUF2946 domain-containing protein n=1 Tax=Pantoea sp. sgz302252 TaxID=3341827 RepID=UPI0036D2813B
MPNLSLIKMRRSHLAAWLGLLAVILLFIAPVISKSLVASPAWHSMMMPGMAMDDMAAMNVDTALQAAMPEHQHAMAGDEAAMPEDQHAMSGGKMATPNGAGISMMDDSACGYCVLLAHLPLDLTRLPPLWSALQAARLPALPLLRPVVARFVPRFFHPRAPPHS